MIIDKQSVAEFHCDNGTAPSDVAAPITTLEFEVYSYVLVKADAGNGNVIYVGNKGVTVGDGYPLAAGEEIKIPVDKTTKVYVIGGAASQDYKWLSV